MIRKATTEDTKYIAKLVVAAMGSLAYKFTKSECKNEALKLFEYFVSISNNQYSYENTLVYTVDDKVVGAINAYDGANIEELREPFITFLNSKYHNGSFTMETESEVGEFYIDTLSVNSNYQGKGIGKMLLNAAKAWAKELGHQKIGLLVDFENPGALRLYENTGFVPVDVKTLAGKSYRHLVCEL